MTTSTPLHHNGHDALEALDLLDADKYVEICMVKLQGAMEEALSPLVQKIIDRKDDELVSFQAQHPQANLRLLVLKGFDFTADERASGFLDYDETSIY